MPIASIFKNYAALERRKRHLQHLLVATEAAISAADDVYDECADSESEEERLMEAADEAQTAYTDARLARDSDSDSDIDINSNISWHYADSDADPDAAQERDDEYEGSCGVCGDYHPPDRVRDVCYARGVCYDVVRVKHWCPSCGPACDDCGAEYDHYSGEDGREGGFTKSVDSARYSSARYSSTQLDTARLDTARLSSIQLGTIQLDSARCRSARYGSTQLDTARQDTARHETQRQQPQRAVGVGIARPCCAVARPVGSAAC